MNRFRKQLLVLVGAVVLMAGVASILAKGTEQVSDSKPSVSRLAVVWSSADPDVAHNACLMYAHAAATKKWFDEVRLIVWGPSDRLLATDKDLQAKVKAMIKDGVIVQACIHCADSYGATEALRKLGVEVKPMGQPLTDMLKSDYKVLTF